MNFPKFTIIIPIFNEKKNIVELLKNITLKVKKLKFEIFLIDDDSTDGSQELITNYIKNKDDIYLIKRRKKPRDLSLSCIDGFKRSKKKFILVMDGDGQHDPKFINTMVRTISNNDLDIVGDSSMLIASVVAPAKQEEISDEDSIEDTEAEDASADDTSEKNESDSE